MHWGAETQPLPRARSFAACDGKARRAISSIASCPSDRMNCGEAGLGGSCVRSKRSAAGGDLPSRTGRCADRSLLALSSSRAAARSACRLDHVKRTSCARSNGAKPPASRQFSPRVPCASRHSRRLEIARFSRRFHASSFPAPSGSRRNFDCRRAVSIARGTLVAACGSQGSVPHESITSRRSGSILPRSASRGRLVRGAIVARGNSRLRSPRNERGV